MSKSKSNSLTNAFPNYRNFPPSTPSSAAGILSQIHEKQDRAKAVLGESVPQMGALLEGRQKIALNAIKSGVTGLRMFLTADEFPHYMRIGRDLMRDLRPRNTREVLLAQRIIDNNWRCQRIAVLEANLYAVGSLQCDNGSLRSDPASQEIIAQTQSFKDDCARVNSIEKLSRHEARLTRMGLQLEAEYDRRVARYGNKPWDEQSCEAYKWYESMAALGAELAAAKEKPATTPESTASSDRLICQTAPAALQVSEPVTPDPVRIPAHISQNREVDTRATA